MMQEQLNRVLKIPQGSPKTSRTKIKGPFWPYSPLQAPGCAPNWRPPLEDQTKAYWGESYFVGLPKMSTFAGSKLIWIMYHTFCWRRSFLHLSQIQLQKTRFSVLTCFHFFHLI